MTEQFTAVWECPECSTQNEWRATCTSCSFGSSSVPSNILVESVVSVFARMTYLLCMLSVYFVLPIGLFMTLVGTQTVPLILLGAQLIFAVTTHSFIVRPAWNLCGAVLLSLVSRISISRARGVLVEL